MEEREQVGGQGLWQMVEPMLMVAAVVDNGGPLSMMESVDGEGCGWWKP